VKGHSVRRGNASPLGPAIRRAASSVRKVERDMGDRNLSAPPPANRSAIHTHTPATRIWFFKGEEHVMGCTNMAKKGPFLWRKVWRKYPNHHLSRGFSASPPPAPSTRCDLATVNVSDVFPKGVATAVRHNF
jgi:hypothetical protein